MLWSQSSLPFSLSSSNACLGLLGTWTPNLNFWSLRLCAANTRKAFTFLRSQLKRSLTHLKSGWVIRSLSMAYWAITRGASAFTASACSHTRSPSAISVNMRKCFSFTIHFLFLSNLPLRSYLWSCTATGVHR